jgi:hypothetical protein
MSTAMILLVGEQPAPNLLPTRHLQPDAAVLVYTDRTRQVAENLKALLEPGCHCWLCQVHPYRINEIQQELDAFLTTTVSDYALVFNLTGGTKAMALGAFRIVQMWNSPFVYFQTEGNRSLLYHYAFDGDEIILQATDELPVTISLDDYLRMYLRSTPGIAEVITGLRPQGLEAQEVDFVVRCGNQVGIGEIKTKGAKRGIDQLNAVAEQRYLGTYLRKFLVSGKPVDRNNKNLAQAYRIEVIELLSYGESGVLSANDKQKLAETVRGRLGVR